MLTREQALYQLKLILDCLPREEYRLISKETIAYIEKNMIEDPSVKIDPKLDLEEQNVDDLTLEYLQEILEEMDYREQQEIRQNHSSHQPVEGKDLNTQIEIIRLKEIIEKLKKENQKIPKAKTLMIEYKEALAKSEEEKEKLEHASCHKG